MWQKIGGSTHLYLGYHAFGVATKDAKKRGRKAGSFRVPTTDLVAQLETVSSETSTMHNKLHVPVRTLNMSKRLAATSIRAENPKALKKANCARGFGGRSYNLPLTLLHEEIQYLPRIETSWQGRGGAYTFGSPTIVHCDYPRLLREVGRFHRASWFGLVAFASCRRSRVLRAIRHFLREHRRLHR